MDDLHKLTVTGISPRRGGIWVLARHLGWHQDYRFFIPAGGRVKGRTSGGTWVDLSSDASTIISDKVERYIKENNLFDAFERVFPWPITQ